MNALLIDLNNSSRGFNHDYVRQVEDKYNEVVLSQAFYDAMMKRQFTNDNGLLRAQIIEKIRQPVVVRLSLYKTWKWWSRVVGYFAGGNTVHCNAKYWNHSSVLDNASFLCHEISHMKGFMHSSAIDYQSVPYSLNAVFSEIG